MVRELTTMRAEKKAPLQDRGALGKLMFARKGGVYGTVRKVIEMPVRKLVDPH